MPTARHEELKSTYVTYVGSEERHQVLLVVKRRKGRPQVVHVAFLDHPGMTVRGMIATNDYGQCGCHSIARDIWYATRLNVYSFVIYVAVGDSVALKSKRIRKRLDV